MFGLEPSHENPSGCPRVPHPSDKDLNSVTLLNLSDDIAEARVEGESLVIDMMKMGAFLSENYQDSISKLNRISSVARVVW